MATHSGTLAWKVYGWRSLVGCSPWGHEELDTTEWIPFHFWLSSIGEGNGNLLQCSCLENPRDGGAWWAAVYGVAQSRTRLKRLSSCCSMFSSNCCLLTCIQISQEAGQVVWYSYLLKNFPQFVVIHTVKGFSIVNKAEIDVFLEFLCLFNDPMDVGNLISGSSTFSKPRLNIWKFMVHLLLKPGLENFEFYFLACEMSAVLQ